jgi:isocitrate dehydrogenase
LTEREADIIEELNAVQGRSVDLGGYYRFNDSLAESVMRPSQLFNDALKQLDEPAVI